MRPKWSDLRFGSADFRPEMVDFGHDKADFGPQWADLELEVRTSGNSVFTPVSYRPKNHVVIKLKLNGVPRTTVVRRCKSIYYNFHSQCAWSTRHSSLLGYLEGQMWSNFRLPQPTSHTLYVIFNRSPKGYMWSAIPVALL